MEEVDIDARFRRRGRRASLVGFFGLGLGLVYMGREGWALNTIPAEYAGYFLFVAVLLGVCGVNIWLGGPFDLRHDD